MTIDSSIGPDRARERFDAELQTAATEPCDDFPAPKDPAELSSFYSDQTTSTTDDDGTTHEPNINRVRAAGITTGCTATTYCPKQPVTRGQMAAFLFRALAN